MSGELFHGNQSIESIEKTEKIQFQLGSQVVIVEKKNKYLFEGEYKDGKPNGKGYIYCVFQQYKFAEYAEGRLSGSCYKMALNWGEISQGTYKEDKKVGVWKKLLNNGYYLKQIQSKKQVVVTFPFLFGDKFEGDVGSLVKNQQKQGIYFQNGTYQFQGTQKLLFQIKEVKSVWEIEKVKERGLNWAYCWDHIVAKQDFNKKLLVQFLT